MLTGPEAAGQTAGPAAAKPAASWWGGEVSAVRDTEWVHSSDRRIHAGPRSLW